MEDFWGMTGDCKPDSATAKVLQDNFKEQCLHAATILDDSDVLILYTGAGFSADSGLAVYADVAQIPSYSMRGLDYCDICIPDWLEIEPDLFYGFWGQCFNDYRTTKPHEGYTIISKWKKDKNCTTTTTTTTASTTTSSSSSSSLVSTVVASELQSRMIRKVKYRHSFQEDSVMDRTAYNLPPGTSCAAGAFFSFTSNVDAHFLDIFEPQELYECHGNIELWQCSSLSCPSGIWRAPIQHQFVVDPDTMLAPSTITTTTTTINPSETKMENIIKDNHNNKKKNGNDDEDETDTTVPHIGHTAGVGKRNNLLQYMPPAKDDIGWSMTGPRSSNNDDNDTTTTTNDDGSVIRSNWPKCGHCSSLARPAILMFGDWQWKADRAQSMRWALWKESLLDLCEHYSRSGDGDGAERDDSSGSSSSDSSSTDDDQENVIKPSTSEMKKNRDFQNRQQQQQPLKVCIMEIGCGLNVPTCRCSAESLLEDIQDKGGLATLIRINPDYPLSGSDTADSLIPIMSRGLAAIRQIDEIYQERRRHRHHD